MGRYIDNSDIDELVYVLAKTLEALEIQTSDEDAYLYSEQAYEAMNRAREVLAKHDWEW